VVSREGSSLLAPYSRPGLHAPTIEEALEHVARLEAIGPSP
jgi:hypothetical protein